MSIRSVTGQRATRSANRPVYLAAFRRYVHELISLGHARLDPMAHSTSEEPVITGELIRMMRTVIESPGAPAWAVYFTVHDDPPVNAPRRYGKRRQRVDIEFERTQPGPHPRFQFEAKRLRDASSIDDYLGKDGLGCFTEAQYARDRDEAGMLGYLQAGEAESWAVQIRANLKQNARKYRLRSDGAWKQCPVAQSLEHTYRTRHNRSKPFGPIAIDHILIRFF